MTNATHETTTEATTNDAGTQPNEMSVSFQDLFDKVEGFIVAVDHVAGDKMEGATENAASAAGNAAENAGDAMSNAASNAGAAASNAASSAGAAIGNAAEAATVTPAVKTAIGANAGLKGTNINVDTLGSKDSIALRGKVGSQAQKKLAESVAKKAAPGYKIVNQLTVGK